MKMFVIYNVKCVNTPEAKKLKQISPEDPKDPHSQGVLVTSHSIYTKNHVSSIIKKITLDNSCLHCKHHNTYYSILINPIAWYFNQRNSYQTAIMLIMIVLYIED